MVPCTVSRSKSEQAPRVGPRGCWRCQLQSKMLRNDAQQVFGDLAFGAQIERDFDGAGQLLSSRKSRTDILYVEILLPLRLKFDNIPHYVPAIKSTAIQELPTKTIAEKCRTRGN